MTSMLMHLLMAALLIFLGYCLGRADGAMADARRKVGAGRTAPEGHNVDVTGPCLHGSGGQQGSAAPEPSSGD